MKETLLIVDDDPNILESLVERFTAKGYAIQTATSGAEAITMARQMPDLILLDLQLPRGDGIHVLQELGKQGIALTVVVITAHGSVAKAVEAMRAGAHDFIEKPFDAALIDATVKRAMAHGKLRRRFEALESAAVGPGFVTVDPAMESMLALSKKAASSTATILILGESGAGKEVVAQQIHAWSPRAEGPFVAVNCAALSETLLESELFGYEKGAFTGAGSRRRGKIELAHRGTLFLDEIGDISPAFQAKLLRVLQERSFERVGGTESIAVDVRVLAATNKDLDAEVKSGRFREDLYYRLNVIAVRVPPLRERRQDIAALSEHFASVIGRETKKASHRVSAPARAVLQSHSWPGNVRELRNVIERAVVLSDDAEILPEDLPPDLLEVATGEPSDGFHGRVEAFRKSVLEQALAECDGNRTRAAESLGLQRTYLMRLIKKYGL